MAQVCSYVTLAYSDLVTSSVHEALAEIGTYVSTRQSTTDLEPRSSNNDDKSVADVVRFFKNTFCEPGTIRAYTMVAEQQQTQRRQKSQRRREESGHTVLSAPRSTYTSETSTGTWSVRDSEEDIEERFSLRL